MTTVVQRETTTIRIISKLWDATVDVAQNDCITHFTYDDIFGDASSVMRVSARNAVHHETEVRGKIFPGGVLLRRRR